MIEREKDVLTYGKRARGRREIISHFRGESLSPLRAIYAKCFDCMGYYADGVTSCEIANCPLFPFMPFNPSRTRKKRTISPEARERARERLKAARNTPGFALYRLPQID